VLFFTTVQKSLNASQLFTTETHSLHRSYTYKTVLLLNALVVSYIQDKQLSYSRPSRTWCCFIDITWYVNYPSLLGRSVCRVNNWQ